MAQAGGKAEGDNGEQEQQTQQQSSAEVRWREPDYYVTAFELLERGVEVNLPIGPSRERRFTCQATGWEKRLAWAPLGR